MDTIATFIVVLSVVFFYLLPSIVAAGRHHRNASAICMMNLLLGWTFLGWVISLVWACTANVETRAA